MKKQVSTLLAGALLATLAVSCKKDTTTETTQPTSEITSMDEMVVSKDFSFQTDHEVSYNFTMPSTVSGKYLVEIYDNNPTIGGVISSVLVESAGSIDGKVMMPRGASKMYAKVTSPNGSSEVHALTINGDNVYKSFAKGTKAVTKTVVVSPDCNTGCDQTISSGGWVNLDNAKTYCLTGNIQGINDNNGNAVIRVCGNVTVSGNISIKGNTEIQITDGSSLTVQQINMNDAGGQKGHITVYPTGTLTINGNFSAHGVVTNHGTFKVNSDAYIYGAFTNNSLFEVLGSGYSTLNRNGLGDIVNNGTMKYTNGNLTENSNTIFINNCQLWVKKELKFDATVHNYAYMYTDGNFRHNSSSTVTMYDGAMLSVNGNANGPLNGDFVGSGSTSVIKINNGISSNSSASYSGNLEICASSYGTNNSNNITLNGALQNGAVAACDQAYIATSACNPEGNGTPTITDTDNDGVADDNDAFPNDPNKASISYYPSSNTRGTLAYEDLWPAEGDYDFNDLVVDYQYTFHKNANNQVVEIQFDYKVNAIGGSYKNGFGFQFDFAPSAVQSVSGQQLNGNVVTVSGNGTESGQSKATIIAFENARDIITNGSAFVNTEDGVPYVQPAGNTIIIELATPQTEAALGAAPYNPFIFVNETRGREVHLKNFAPTDLANTALLGTNNDDSNAGNGTYYQNENGLPWAISISDSFVYPKEKADIVTGYNFFATWAMSEGTSATNWYANESGNRTNSNLFLTSLSF